MASLIPWCLKAYSTGAARARIGFRSRADFTRQPHSRRIRHAALLSWAESAS